MRELSEEQIDHIAEDIRLRGVFTKNLQEDLLDHICCFIEEQPDDGTPFEKAYLQALESFGKNGLQEVQDETLYLLNKPYLTKMKKFMYISGALASISLLGGAFFKIQHWPGASMLLILGTLLLCFLFIPYFFYIQYKEQTEKKGKVIAAIGLLTALFLSMGALFKIMHWPGAIIMVGGFFFLFVVFLPLYVMNGIRNPLTRMSSVSNGFLFACTGGFMMLLSFARPSLNVTNSYATITENENSVVLQMERVWNKTSLDSSLLKAMNVFQSVCKAQYTSFSEMSGEGMKLSEGEIPSPQKEREVTDAINKAVDELNASFSNNSGWKKLDHISFHPAPVGNMRFELLQFREKAYACGIFGKI